MHIETIFKRSHSKTSFQIDKITDAILKAMLSVNNGTLKDAQDISERVYEILLERKSRADKNNINIKMIISCELTIGPSRK